MLRIGIPVLGVTDIARAAAFWTAALRLDVSPQWHSETWRTLCHHDGKGPALGLMHSTSPPELRPRLHLDLFTDTAEDRVERSDDWSASARAPSIGPSTRRSTTSSFWPTRMTTSSAWWT